ncbi:hypothetical protein [Acinetobacter sp. SFB]|uniref:hypothetical protein n=1 Tax=Acinetobacter sp. SFB TaxID=1805634 RepID=UPI000A6CFA19|nr:hypothetical protein [Acinetobacter sp. SFB]
MFSWKNLNHVKKWQIPRVINTDKLGKSSSALSELVAGIENFISIATSLSDGKGIGWNVMIIEIIEIPIQRPRN